MLVSLTQFFSTFGALCLLLSNQVIESKVLFLFIFSVVGIMRLELKNIPKIHNICSLSGLLMLISKIEVQQWTRNASYPKVAKGVLCPVNSLQFQKSCSWVDVFQTWVLKIFLGLWFFFLCFVFSFLSLFQVHFGCF